MLPAEYLQYANRRLGNDHDRFGYSPLPKRPPVHWPSAAKVAVLITVHFEFYPLDVRPAPFGAPGAFYLPPPNVLLYTTSDYGNRIGAYRLFRVLDDFGFKGTAVFNSEVARRYPQLVEEVLARGWEIVASGIDMGQLIHGGMPQEAERALVQQSLDTLRAISGAPVRGWFSPAHSQSDHTLDIVADNGVDYILDWVNDDMPYAVRTATGSLFAMPFTDQWSDDNIGAAQRQPVDAQYHQGLAAYGVLHDEAERFGGRILSLPLHTWVSGQAYRIKTLAALLSGILAKGGCWSATGSEILDAFMAQDAGRR